MFALVCFLALRLPFPLQVKPVQSAEQIVSKVQAFYESTPQLRAKFRQTVINKTFGPRPPSDGKLYIKKPTGNAKIGKMRWEYYGQKSRNHDRKVVKSFLSDGKTLWAVFHEDKHYYVKTIESDLLPVAVTFLSGKGDLNKEFTAELDTSGKYGDKGDLVVKLTPRQPSAQYKYLWLVVDPTDYRVKQSVVLNSQDDENAFRFYEPDLRRRCRTAGSCSNRKRIVTTSSCRRLLKSRLLLCAALVGCGGKPAPAPPSPPVADAGPPAAAGAGFGASLLAEFASEFLAFADAVLAAKPLPPTSFLLPAGAAGLRLPPGGKRPAGPVDWQAVFVDMTVIGREAKGNVVHIAVTLLITPHEMRLIRAWVGLREVAPPTPPPAVPQPIIDQMRVVQTKFRTKDLDSLTFRPADLSGLGEQYVKTIMAEPGWDAETARVLADVEIVAHTPHIIGASGVDAKGEVFMAIGHLEAVGGRFSWVCHGEGCAPLEGTVWLPTELSPKQNPR